MGDVIFAGSVGRSDLPVGILQFSKNRSVKVSTHYLEKPFCTPGMERIPWWIGKKLQSVCPGIKISITWL